jgi:hypothetical protein
MTRSDVEGRYSSKRSFDIALADIEQANRPMGLPPNLKADATSANSQVQEQAQ